MPARRLWVLIAGLPPDSALHRQGKQWTQAHELAAVAIDRGEHWSSLLVQLSGRSLKDGAKPPPGIEMTHPDRPRPERKKKVVSIDQFASQFGGR